MTRPTFSLIIWFALSLLRPDVPVFAQNQSQFDTNPPVQIQVQTYPDKVFAGHDAWIAVQIILHPEWHIYGNPKGPGPGLPTVLAVHSLPEGVTADHARFLPAEKLLEPDLGPDEWVWIYRKKTTVYLRLSTPVGLSPQSYQIQLHLQLALCRVGVCMPFKTDLAAPLHVVSDLSAEASIPPSITKEIQLTHAGKTQSGSQPTDLAETLSEPTQKAISKLVEVPSLKPRAVMPSLEVKGLVKAALFAILAGFILNFMPCVLPVVSLKVLGFVQQAQESGRRVALLGLSFAAGIFVVFLVLAALASFAGYGWGELFQKQSFLIAMIGLIFTMALCLFGLFQLPIPHFASSGESISVQRQGYFESFYKGTLATFLATPCSGPLLGGAMAWTLRQPPIQIFVVFSFLGLGMASPYVVMSFYPTALKWLPRPGTWLIHFERFMGFALLATVVYLLTILPENMRVWIVLFCLFLAIGFYMWGQMTSLSDSSRRRIAVRLLAVIIMVAGGWLSLKTLPSTGWNEDLLAEAAESASWQVYTEAKLLEAVQGNRWVIVDFTADWCPNCILVERTALQDQQVVETFRKHNALLLKADLTRENPPAKRLLEKMGSRSIPFLALFPPGENFWQPFFLRDIYRARDVLRAFEMAAEEE
ncbi:MAG: thioredoxin family protein [Deltaproteobacteria bacterium]|nr:thioredoxin family protein [Deltaproteobacteria bacterium]